MEPFAKEVLEGLASKPKRLPSKYFYDKQGDELFQQIMALDEYYLTETEYAILESNKTILLTLFGEDRPFDLIEFGAGDGYKTRVLLAHFIASGADFCYKPIDISGHVLRALEKALLSEFPRLKVHSLQNDYFEALKALPDSDVRKVVLFLGSNIGNFTGRQAVEFLHRLHYSLQKGDLVLIGFDLKKDPDVILRAYNDSKGVTREFNFNLLRRINTELNANFDMARFRHYPVYDPGSGTTTSFLVSTVAHTVEILDTAIRFDAWEAIRTEISQKYDKSMVEELAAQSGFEIVTSLTDHQNYFLNSLWRRM